MNTLIFKLTQYIIDNNIKNISIEKILDKNTKYIDYYIEQNKLESLDVYLFDFKIKIFKKLVLYDYCFTYKIENFTNNQDLKLINDYILNKNSNLLFVHTLEGNFQEFIDWCAKYNRNNGKKIYFSYSDEKIIFK